MLHKGACVFSPTHGHGQVVAPGNPPLVRLLNGQERELPPASLRLLPPDELDTIIARQTGLEHKLAWLVWGPLAELGPLWVKDDEGLWTTPEAFARRAAQEPEPVQYCSPDELGARARALDPSEFRADAIRCRVSRTSPHAALRAAQ